MPEAIVAIIIISLFCGTVLGLTGMILKHRRSTRAIGSGGSEQGIRTSELKQLMREAATEATAPLEARIDELHSLIEKSSRGQHRLLEAPVDDMLEFDEPDEVEKPVGPRRRVR